jgi:uncharacterized protein (DUF849 family)
MENTGISDKLNPIIIAALNGSRLKSDHPKIPVSSEDLVKSAAGCLLAGAKEIHFHVRDQEGNETLDADFVCKQVHAVKTALPHVPVGISTGQWIEPDLSRRIALIKNWYYLPDFVSVNGNEEGSELIIFELLKKGIEIEAGISDLQAAKFFAESNLLNHCFRILLEPGEQELPAAMENLKILEGFLSDSWGGKYVLLHGLNLTCWDILDLAIKKGYVLRIGFEDTLWLRTGGIAHSNGDLVRETVSAFSKYHTPIA